MKTNKIAIALVAVVLVAVGLYGLSRFGMIQDAKLSSAPGGALTSARSRWRARDRACVCSST